MNQFNKQYPNPLQHLKNHKIFTSIQKKDVDNKNNKNYIPYYINNTQLNVVIDKNKSLNKTIKSMRKPSSLVVGNNKRAMEQKNIALKEINNNCIINKRNNEIFNKENNDYLNNNKYIKKKESATNINWPVYNKREIELEKYKINNIINKRNYENNNKEKNDNLIKLNNNKFIKKNESAVNNNHSINNNKVFPVHHKIEIIDNKKEQEKCKNDSSDWQLPERLKTINRIRYEDNMKKNNQISQINSCKVKNEINKQNEEKSFSLSQIDNKKSIRNFYKSKTSLPKIDENNEKKYHDIKKTEKPKDFAVKNTIVLNQKINKNYDNNRRIERGLKNAMDDKSFIKNNYDIESKNVDFKINKNLKGKDLFIVKRNNFNFSGKEITKEIVRNVTDFKIIDNLKNNFNNSKIINQEIELNTKETKNNKNINKYIIYCKKQKEINNRQESIQKNSQDTFIKENNNITIEQKEFEKKKKQDNDKKIHKKLNKIYGFINNGNNCYLNSSLQLLTRVSDLKEKILNFNETNKDFTTNGQLTIEFKNILYQIESDEKEKKIISPDKLKRVMATIDERYYQNHQEDSNEFISFFLNTLLSETANKNKVIDKMEVYDKGDQEAFNRFFKKFYIKNGYSFILELFYGIIKTEKKCKSCRLSNFIKFSSFNILDLPIYSLAKSNNNKTLNLKEILNNYLLENKSNGFTCIHCKDNNIYTNTTIYSLPKYLIIFFGRIVENQYLYNEIKYPEEFDFNEYTNNAIKIKTNYKYKLECVIEHSGGAYSGHYTSLCRINDKCWYFFSDNYGHLSQGFESKNAIILLYKAQ